MLRTKKSVFGKGGNCSDFSANSQAKKCLKRQFADEAVEIILSNGRIFTPVTAKIATIG